MGSGMNCRLSVFLYHLRVKMSLVFVEGRRYEEVSLILLQLGLG